jgi:hypothetical protein
MDWLFIKSFAKFQPQAGRSVPSVGQTRARITKGFRNALNVVCWLTPTVVSTRGSLLRRLRRTPLEMQLDRPRTRSNAGDVQCAATTLRSLVVSLVYLHASRMKRRRKSITSPPRRKRKRPFVPRIYQAHDVHYVLIAAVQCPACDLPMTIFFFLLNGITKYVAFGVVLISPTRKS